jgi:hypothetical protein
MTTFPAMLHEAGCAHTIGEHTLPHLSHSKAKRKQTKRRKKSAMVRQVGVLK